MAFHYPDTGKKKRRFQIARAGKVFMYNEYLDYIWKAEKQHLDYEIAKLEGQLRNCRFRLGLLKREMIVCISLVVVPGIFLLLIPILPVNSGFEILDRLLGVMLEVAGLVMQTFYIVLLPFLLYYMVKSITKYCRNLKDRNTYQELTVQDRFNREPPEPEESYAAEETKLIRILSIYYDYRTRLEQMQEKLIEGELTLTADELKEELEKLVYYEEITPLDPHSQKGGKNARADIVIFFIFIWSVILFVLVWT